MPPAGREEVVIVGITTITMLRGIVVFPAVFCTLAVKLNVPIVNGVPDIIPVTPFKLKPVGRLPLAIDQVTGIVPFAISV